MSDLVGAMSTWGWIAAATLAVLIVAVFIALRQDDTDTLVRCPACAEFIRRDATECRYCGRDVSTR